MRTHALALCLAVVACTTPAGASKPTRRQGKKAKAIVADAAAGFAVDVKYSR